MKTGIRFVLAVYTLLMVTGCSATRVSDRQIFVQEQIPRPGCIWVYDFAVTAADTPAESGLSEQLPSPSATQTTEQLEKGRKVGAQIAVDLVTEIRAMGMPAERVMQGAGFNLHDIVIRGYILSIDEGSAAKRVAIGFGSGASAMKVAVEGFQVTEQGLRKLGSGRLDAGGSKSPGSALGAATFVATHNPVGLIVSTGAKVYGEKSGRSKVEERGREAVKEIADQMKTRFQKAGWI